MIRIGNGAGFLGDQLDAPRRLVEKAQLDCLTLEYLAELTLSILARKREKDPLAGYADDFILAMQGLIPTLQAQPQLKIITNAGGMNPAACAVAVSRLLQEAGLGTLRVGVVTGDDLTARISELQAKGCDFAHLDSGQPLNVETHPPVSANAYLGAQPIVECLAQDAQIVITGRVADASLTLAPAVHHFGWAWDAWDQLAGASAAGHVIECGAQATGGFYPHWQEAAIADVGYPIAEIGSDGSAVITKAPDTGGVVNRETVAEQIVYEIGDPAAYLTPDVSVDFTQVQLALEAANRVQMLGARGRAAPQGYKVSLAYRAGFTASGQLLVYGRDCLAKARACADMVFERLRLAGVELQQTQVEFLGAGSGVPGTAHPPFDLREVCLRIAVRDSRHEAVERFTREMVPLATSGPGGLAGYTAARGMVRPVYAYWPTTVSRELLAPRSLVRPASKWAAALGS